MQLPSYLAKDHLISLATAATTAASTLVVDHFKSINDIVGITPVDKWMDSVAGIGHRVKFGHGIEVLPEIFEKFGWQGLKDGMAHLSRDFCSPHGLPIIGLEKIRNTFGFKMMDAIDWGCLNIGDMLPSGLSAWGAYRSFSRISEADVISRQDLAFQATGIVLSLTFGAISTNPIVITKVIFDIGMLSWSIGKSDEWSALLESQIVKEGAKILSETIGIFAGCLTENFQLIRI